MEEKELIKAEETTVSPEVWSCLNCGTTVPSTQDYCNKCGAYKPEPEPQKPAEPPKKFCKHCGKRWFMEENGKLVQFIFNENKEVIALLGA